jgi:N-acetylglutamate synthase-like GNAT family acetyltransferase
MTLAIRPATAADLAPTVELLETAGLPVADLTVGKLAFAADKDEVFQGIICLESFGPIAFLRSLVVAADGRGTGIGAALVTALEVACLSNNVDEMWLLTINADRFFSKLGYETRDRVAAPDAIRGTAEFSGLCPVDAILMSKKLG